jgi:hypothetical protein
MFPAQPPGFSYGITIDVTTEELLTLQQPFRWRVPASSAELPATWMAVDFDDSLWATGLPGFGFDTGTRFDPLILADVEAAMRGVNASAFLRCPFVYDAEEAPPVETLTLQIRYDDGFVAYLNGVEIARRSAPDPPLWNSIATEERPATAAVVLTDIDVTSSASLLRDGTNILAIHALNRAVDDDDLLMAARLKVSSIPVMAERYFPNPTLGHSNFTAFLGVVADTKFSVDRGFYNAPFVLRLTNATPGAVIRFTLDGSPPSLVTGVLYTGPLPINKTTTLRAASFKPGYQPSDIDTHTYIFVEDVLRQNMATASARRFPPTWGQWSADYEMDRKVIGPNDNFGGRYAATIRDDLRALPALSLVMNITDLFGASGGIYLNPELHGTAGERPTSLEVIYPDDTKGEQVNCGARIHGGASRSLDLGKLSFRLVFKDKYGPSQWHYPVFGTYSNATDHFDDLVLRANGQEGWVGGRSDSTYLRDTFARETLLAMGSVASHSQWFHLYLNGLYWGIYELVERPDASLSSAYFGGDKDDWDAVTVGLTEGRAANGDLNAWATLLARCRVDLSTATNYMRLLGRNADGTPNPALPIYLDVRNMIDYMILNFYMAMNDWPDNNYWTGRKRTAPSTGFKFYPWDADFSMDNVTQNIVEVFTGVAAPYGACRRNPEFRMLFADRLHKHFSKGGALYVDRLKPAWDPRSPERNVPAARFARLCDGIRRALVAESARWGDHRPRATPATRDLDWQPAINGMLTNFLSLRRNIVMQQFYGAGLASTVEAPEFSQPGGAVPLGYRLSITNFSPSGTIYYTLDGSDPRQLGEALNPSASAYAGPIELSRATTVRARVRLTTRWSAIVEGDFYLQHDFSKLQLSEVMYNPPKDGAVDGDEFEFLELKNTGPELLDLTGLTFTRGLDFTFTNGTVLAPGQYFVLVRNPAQFAAHYPAAPWHGLYPNKLDNNGETLALGTPLGATVFSVRYDNAAPWPAEADNSGLSLQRMTFNLAATNPVSWLAAPPTPGAALPPGLNDSDDDGLPDDWEQTYGFVSGVNDANSDPDGDGLNNLEEFIAGTNPLLAADALRLKAVSTTRVGTNVSATLEFEARSNKTYTVIYSATSTGTSWTKLPNINAAPTNRVWSLNDVWPASLGQRFYRLASPKLP